MAAFALGSDTGGSVRQPAAFCGVLGLKPTYCAISRYGLIPMASSLDCVGILTRSAADTEIVFSALCGKDERDHTVLVAPKSDAALKPISELRVAVVRELLDDAVISKEMGASLRSAMDLLTRNGARIEEVSLPAPAQALAAYCVISAAEAASNMARFDGIRFGKRSEESEDLFSLYANTRGEFLGDEVKRRILFGTSMLSAQNRARYYDSAISMREQIRRRLLKLFEDFDLILTPTTPTGAFLRGEVRSQAQRRRADLCAVYSSLAGLPALSVPFGKTQNGLPLAVQLTAAPFAEKTIFRVAELLEEQG
jgi:aspartyl-tRNA(Asn)/glutamyl-tRNA(Gln) amidotransferase subunit A